MTEQKGEQKQVVWFLPKKALIKFENCDEPFTIAKNVMKVSDFVKYPILKGDQVQVTIKDDEVIFLRKVSTGTKSKSGNTTKTSTDDSESETKTLTIEAIFENKSVKFREEQINGKNWTLVSDELQAIDFKDLGLLAKNKVVVKIVDGIITDVKKVVTEKKEEKKKEADSSNNYYSGKNDSI